MKSLISISVSRFTAIVVLLCLFVNGNIFGQNSNRTTLGRDFWVMFLDNYCDSALTLIAVGDSNAVITVNNPRTNWSTSANLTAGGHVVINIPYTVALTSIFNSVFNAGLHVTSSAEISLYASNFCYASYDITTVIPTNSLGSFYMSQDYPDAIGDSIYTIGYPELGVVAIQDSTKIYIVGYDTVLLMRGQAYQKHLVQGGTFSGVEVHSNNKPFAMFQGNYCTTVPYGLGACDHLYEQSLPVINWGKNFVVVPAQVRRGALGNGDIVRITSSLDSCDIFIDGNLVAANMLKGTTYETIVPYTTVKRIHTSKPTTVCLYLSGGEYGGQPGDPACVVIPPVEQGVPKAIFAAHNTSLTNYHYTNVVLATRDVPAMEMDGVNISSAFSPVDSVYSFARLSVSPGTHTLHNQRGGFVAYFYGLGEWESYAYTTGMGLKNLSEGLFVNGQNVTVNDTLRINFCLIDSALIQLQTNAEDTSVRWYINGRLLNINRLSFVRHFQHDTVYRLTALTHGNCDSLWCDTLECFLQFINDSIHIHIYDTTCEPTYNFINSIYTSSGTYNHILRRHNGCDSVITLHLIMGRPVFNTIHDTICNENAYYFAGNRITESGVYCDSNFTVYGCDSITMLNLEMLYWVYPTFMPDLATEEVCLGTTITRVDINTETHGNTYRWIWGDGYVSTSHMGDTVTHNYLKPGMYDVLCNMRALNGCADTSHYRINVYDYTRAEFKWHTLFGEITEPSMFFKNLSHIHEPEFNYYKWVFFNDSTDTNAIGFSNDYEAHYRWPVTDNSDVGFYRVRLVAYTPIRTPIHELLCMDSVDHIIYILNDFLQFPNTVTPNNDGINDIFEIKNLIDGKGFTETELHIYNSWGRMVYYKKNISIREDFWDPSLNNDPSGTYYYRFSAKGHCGNTHRNGVIQVIR